MARYDRIHEIAAEVNEVLLAEDPEADTKEIHTIFHDLEKTVVRSRIIAGNPRIDGREKDMVRALDVRTGVLPRTHGSALFTRGETQAIVTATLGTQRDAQIIDELTGERKDHFLLHYNFPPYCVGETGFVGSPKRREIGHGKLAKRGIAAVMLLLMSSHTQYVLYRKSLNLTVHLQWLQYVVLLLHLWTQVCQSKHLLLVSQWVLLKKVTISLYFLTSLAMKTT